MTTHKQAAWSTELLGALKNIFPYELRQSLKRRLFVVRDMHSRIANLKRAGFACTGFVDGGAHDGEWTRMFWRTFAEAPALLVEPLPDKLAKLSLLARRVAGSSVVPAALGRRSGTTLFRLEQTNSAVITGGRPVDGAPSIEIDMTTLDEVVPQASFAPNLLKLDLQGYEMEALAGSSSLYGTFEVIILEVSLIPIGDGPLFREVDHYLESLRYQLYDIIPQYYRPLDEALWQCDAIYVRDASQLVASRRWS